MPDMTFNTPAGQTVKREMLIAYLNVGTRATPIWAPLGIRVTDSSEEYDWQSETATDILGRVHSSLKKPTINQSFEPCELDNEDEAQKKLWNLMVREQNAPALAAQDMLIVHYYAGVANSAVFAECYTACAISNTGLGGAGGGATGMPISVTYGGERITGTAAISNGVVTFTPDAPLALPKLSTFTIANATFSFDADVNSYTATATASTGAVTATAATSGSAVIILVNGSSIASGDTATWSEGDNLVSVTVSYGGATNVYEAHVAYTAG